MKAFLNFLLMCVVSFGLQLPSHGQVVDELKEGGIRIMQLMRVVNGAQRYPDALPSLLKMMNEDTSAALMSTRFIFLS